MIVPLVRAVVERRQASAPASGGRRKPVSPWRDPRAAWCGHETLRLSAFHFLFFLRSFYFVIAGLDPGKSMRR